MMDKKKQSKKKNQDFLDWADKPIDHPNAKQLEVWFGNGSWGSTK